VAYPLGVAVGWVEVLGSVYEAAKLGSEVSELADATVKVGCPGGDQVEHMAAGCCAAVA
jgi:hypothetical protein